ncbi:MAG: four helix bundle protein [Veillonellales bacterium]
MDEQQGYKNLKVWQDSMDLAVQVIRLTEKLPHHELNGLSLQIRRSAISVPSNIAEGWGRKRDKEFCHFVDIAYGSLCELETQLELAYRCYNIDSKELLVKCMQVQKILSGLRKKLFADSRA